jgi:pimeloyl-ACP methyl ester carboxylesterase
MRRTLLILVLLLAPAAARAFLPEDEPAYRSVFSAAALGVERPSAGLVTAWTLAYRGLVPHAAFAFTRDPDTGRSVWGYANGRPTPEAAASTALANCERQRGALPDPCRLFAQDGRILADPRLVVPPVAGAIGPFRASPFHLRRGPQAARGVFVWGHGFGGNDRDYRMAPTPAFASILNDAGWDVLRFDRDPAEDALYTSQPRLVAGLPVLRGLGYRRIILGGQSRGGWQALMAGAERPEGVEAVIATAPAAHGEAERPNNLAAALEDFRRLLASLPAEGPRVLIALFDKDPFEPEVDRRAALVAEVAAQRSAPLLALWPRDGIGGHGGAYDWRFTRAFGGCVLSLVQAPASGAPRGLRRDPCGGG